MGQKKKFYYTVTDRMATNCNMLDILWGPSTLLNAKMNVMPYLNFVQLPVFLCKIFKVSTATIDEISGACSIHVREKMYREFWSENVT